MAIILLICVVWTQLHQSSRIQEALNWVGRTYAMESELNELVIMALAIEAGARGYALSGNPLFLKPYEEARGALEAQQRKMSSLIHDEQQKTMAARLEHLIAQRVDIAREVIEMRQTAGLDAASDEVNFGEGQRVMNQIRSLHARMLDRQKELLAIRSDAADSQIILSRWTLLLGTSLSMALLGTIFILLLRENNQRQQINLSLIKREEELTDITIRLSLATQAAHIGIWDWHIPDNTLIWDIQMHQLYDISSDDFTGSYDDWIASVHPDDRALCDMAVQQALRNEKPYDITFRIRWPDGTLRYIRAFGQVIWDAQGRPLRMTGVNYDVTYRKLKDIELEQSRSLLSSVVENLPVKLYLKDARDLTIVMLNKAGEQMLGIAREQVIGRTDYDLFPRDQAELYELQEREALRTRAVVEIQEETIITADKGARILRTRKLAIEDADHQPRYLLGISEDITDMKKGEQALIKSREAAEQANHAKSKFLSRMSHELRTPLNSIIGFAQLLQQHPDNMTDEQRDALLLITSSGQHLLQLINEVLDISYVESGKLDIHKEGVPVNAVVQECLALLKSNARIQNNIQMQVQGSLEWMIVADRFRFKQVLLNLLSNAIKYNNANGTVIVECRVRDGWLRLNVSDTGIGIPLDKQKLVFEPFQRFAKDKAQGTGVGLTITRLLVDAMGGRLGFYSEPGTGTTFWMEFPRDRRSVPREANARQPSTAVSEINPAWLGITGKVLYVEDTAANVQLLRMVLKRYLPGVIVLDAGTGEEGVALAKMEQPDLILMDIDLPGISGIEAFRILQKEPATRTIPIVAMSATVMQEDINRVMAEGFTSYITKPFDIKKLPEDIVILLT